MEEVIRKLVKNPKFEEAILNKIGSRIDTEEIEKEIEGLEKQHRQLTGAKGRLGQQMDSLDIMDVFELSDVFWAIQCVSGKSADGFGNNHINVTSPTVINHVIKFFTFFGVRAGDTVIGINTGKFPIRIFLNIFCIVFYLSLIAFSLLPESVYL